jgi:hypothetical protein
MKAFLIKSGMVQEFSLSPLLFNIVLEAKPGTWPKKVVRPHLNRKNSALWHMCVISAMVGSVKSEDRGSC